MTNYKITEELSISERLFVLFVLFVSIVISVGGWIALIEERKKSDEFLDMWLEHVTLLQVVIVDKQKEIDALMPLEMKLAVPVKPPKRILVCQINSKGKKWCKWKRLPTKGVN